MAAQEGPHRATPMSLGGVGDRYGPARPWRRTLALVSVVVATAFLAWLAWVAWEQAHPPVHSSLVGYSVLDEHAATARVAVRLESGAVRASCLVRAFAEDHSVVGETRFTPEYAGTGSRTGTTTTQVDLRTERLATSVELIGCTAPGMNRPR